MAHEHLAQNNGRDLYTRTFTLGLVLAEGPPGVALLTHANTILGATAATLGLAVHTLARVHCEHACEQLCEQAQTTVITRSQ